LKIIIAADLSAILHVKHQNSSSKIWDCLNSSGLNHVTIKSGKRCSSA